MPELFIALLTLKNLTDFLLYEKTTCTAFLLDARAHYGIDTCAAQPLISNRKKSPIKVKERRFFYF